MRLSVIYLLSREHSAQTKHITATDLGVDGEISSRFTTLRLFTILAAPVGISRSVMAVLVGRPAASVLVMSILARHPLGGTIRLYGTNECLNAVRTKDVTYVIVSGPPTLAQRVLVAPSRSIWARWQTTIISRWGTS